MTRRNLIWASLAPAAAGMAKAGTAKSDSTEYRTDPLLMEHIRAILESGNPRLIRAFYSKMDAYYEIATSDRRRERPADADSLGARRDTIDKAVAILTSGDREAISVLSVHVRAVHGRIRA